ncbi:hypothetical protein ACLMJK_007045 [Lecanora helva]
MASRTLHFLNLPGEIRNRIYTFLWEELLPLAPITRREQAYQILRTCRTVRNEAAYVLAEDVGIRIIIGSPVVYQDGYYISLTSAPISQPPTPFIQNLDLRITIPRSGTSPLPTLLLIHHFSGSTIPRNKCIICLHYPAPNSSDKIDTNFQASVFNSLKALTGFRQVDVWIEYDHNLVEFFFGFRMARWGKLDEVKEALESTLSKGSRESVEESPGSWEYCMRFRPAVGEDRR